MKRRTHYKEGVSRPFSIIFRCWAGEKEKGKKKKGGVVTSVLNQKMTVSDSRKKVRCPMNARKPKGRGGGGKNPSFRHSECMGGEKKRRHKRGRLDISPRPCLVMEKREGKGGELLIEHHPRLQEMGEGKNGEISGEKGKSSSFSRSRKGRGGRGRRREGGHSSSILNPREKEKGKEEVKT